MPRSLQHHSFNGYGDDGRGLHVQRDDFHSPQRRDVAAAIADPAINSVFNPTVRGEVGLRRVLHGEMGSGQHRRLSRLPFWLWVQHTASEAACKRIFDAVQKNLPLTPAIHPVW